MTTMDDAEGAGELSGAGAGPVAATRGRDGGSTRSLKPSAAELPVVARLMVEIRSDGTATIARAGLTDERNNEKTVIEARGATPLALAMDLARHLIQLSLQGPRAARSLLRGGELLRRQPPK